MDDSEVRKSLGEHKEENSYLQKYIETVLLTIMERHPELLEIKNK